MENSARMGRVMRKHMDRLAAKHVCIKEARQIGLFGCIELRADPSGAPLVPYGGSHPVIARLNTFLKDNGLFTMIAGSIVMCNPPLCINEEEMAFGMDVIDRALVIVDGLPEFQSKHTPL